MKNYHDYKKESIGTSDIATLIFAGSSESGTKAEPVGFGKDGNYNAYIVDKDADIGDHYKLIGSFNSWLKVYDDYGLSFKVYGDIIEIYRSGQMGCIIKVI